MRHLLEVLRKDFEEPTNISTSTKLEKKEKDVLCALLPHLDSGGKQVKTKEDNDQFPYVSMIKYSDSPDYADPLLVSTPLPSPERTTSPARIDEKEEEGHNEEKGAVSTLLSEHVTDHTGTSEEDFHETDAATANNVTDDHNEYTTRASDEEQAEIHFDGQSKEIEDLGRSLSESLHVSDNGHGENEETVSEQHANTVASVSDDEF